RIAMFMMVRLETSADCIDRGVRGSDRFFFFSSRRRHTRCLSDWSSDVCSSDLKPVQLASRKQKKTGIWGDGILGTGVLRSPTARSEERRVGKECRYRGTPEEGVERSDERDDRERRRIADTSGRHRVSDTAGPEL